MRLFIADDSEILRSRLVDLVSEIQGIDIVGEAKNCKDALKAVEILNPDVVILDIRMPGEDGMLALEGIKKTKKWNPTVIIFTNYPYLQYRKRCIDAGADFFFYKALEFEKLIDLLKNMVQSA